MRSRLTYRHTVGALYFANLFQAVGSVFPIFLVPIRTLYGISYTQFGLLVGLNFITQVSSDVLFSKPVDKFGFRPFVVLSPLCSATGLVLYALSPVLFPQNLFAGLCVGTFIYAVGGGLQELLLSPILDALPLPREQKSRKMSLLHSCFAWGQIVVILTTTGLLAVLGPEGWQKILCGWAVAPLICAFVFSQVPLCPRVAAGQEMTLKQLFASRVFLWALAAIFFGGAAEVTMSQWASAFIERGLHLPKLMGDTLGVCGFSLMLATGRTLYGFQGNPDKLHHLMIGGSLCAAALYAVAALAPHPMVGLVACGLTGLCASMLWPGSVIVTARHLPLAGASMFAMLSALGDLGASASSFVTGRVSDSVRRFPLFGFTGEEAGLRTGLLCAGFFSLLCFVSNLRLRQFAAKKEHETG